MKDCVESRSEFGINFVDSEKMNPIGCGARVVEIVRSHRDGRMDVVVEGKSRYTLKHLVESDSPYFVGRVVFFSDKAERSDRASRRRAIGLYNRFVAVAFKGTVPAVSISCPDASISFLLAQKAGLELKDRQALLELRSERDRLAVLCKHFESMLPLVASREVYEKAVMNDGYLTPRVNKP